MKERYIFNVSNGIFSTYMFREKLRTLGFAYEKGSIWKKTVSANDYDTQYKKIKKALRFTGLKLVVVDTIYERSADYRKSFFSHYKPNFGKNRYFCIYCGVPYKKEEICVDHIIPVKKAKETKKAKRLLSLIGAESVNNYKNLGAACKRCNTRKSAKMGLWVIRGFIGKHTWFQYARLVARIVIVMLIIGVLAYFAYNTEYLLSAFESVLW